MHVLGARFSDLESATAAMHAVRARIAIARGDVAVRPLGSTRYDEPAADFLLAGRFESGHVRAVADIVAEHGGTVISRRAELPGESVSARGRIVVQSGTAMEARIRDGGPGARPGLRAVPPRVAPRKRWRRPAAPLRVRAARERRLGA
jgi:hypothetical protein